MCCSRVLRLPRKWPQATLLSWTTKKEPARELVERIANELRSTGFKVDTAVEVGDIREKIIDSAAEWGADLIVVGSHGRSGIPRLLLGSVAEFVARHAKCSVEIVRTSVLG